MELLHKAAKLGLSRAHYNLGVCYDDGNIIEKDVKKAKHHYHVAAMGGDVLARLNIGCDEKEAGSI